MKKKDRLKFLAFNDKFWQQQIADGANVILQS